MAKNIVTLQIAIEEISKSESLKDFTQVIEWKYQTNRHLQKMVNHYLKTKNDEKKNNKAKLKLIGFIIEEKLQEEAQKLENLKKMVQESDKLSSIIKKVEPFLNYHVQDKELINKLEKYEKLVKEGKKARKERENLYYEIVGYLENKN